MRVINRVKAKTNPGKKKASSGPAQAHSDHESAFYFIHTDHLGTPQALTDKVGTLVWRGVYDPFGKAVADEDPDGDGKTVRFDLRFPGQYYDRETGLYCTTFGITSRKRGSTFSLTSLA